MLLVTSLEKKKCVQVRPLPHSKHIPNHYDVRVLVQLYPPQIPSYSRFLVKMCTWMQYLEKLPCILMLHVLLADMYTGFEEKEM